MSRASSSPEIVRASTPKRAFTCARTASPPPASRIALVPTTSIFVDAEALDDLGVAVEARVGALDGLGCERARLVDALTEPRDGRVLLDRDELAVAPLGDEEQHGVRPDVDRRNAHELTSHKSERPRERRREASSSPVRAASLATQRMLFRFSISSTFGWTTSSTRRFFLRSSSDCCVDACPRPGSVSP